MIIRYCFVFIILLVCPSLYASEIDDLRDDLRLVKQFMDDMQYDQAIIPLWRVKRIIENYFEVSSKLPPDYVSIETQADEYLEAFIVGAETMLKDEAERLNRELNRYALPRLNFPGSKQLKNLVLSRSDYSYLEELLGIKESNQDKTERWVPLTELPGFIFMEIEFNGDGGKTDYINFRQDYFDFWINNNEFVKFIKNYPQGELLQHLSKITRNADQICSSEDIQAVNKLRQPANESFKHISDLIELSKHWSEPSNTNMWLQLEEEGKVTITHRSHLGNRVNIESQQWFLKVAQYRYSMDIEFLEKLSDLAERVEYELKTGKEIDRLLKKLRTLSLKTGWALHKARGLYPKSASIDDSGQEAIDAVIESAILLKDRYQSFYDTYLKENQIEKTSKKLEGMKNTIKLARDKIQDINLVIQQTNRFYKALLDASKQAQIQLQRADDCVRQHQLKVDQNNPAEDNKQAATETVAMEKKISVRESPPADDVKQTDIADQVSHDTGSAPTGDVSGGIRIVGKETLVVGEEALYSVEDYGGKPFSEASWNTLRENLRMFANGSVLALEPGEAMIMVRSEGMTAFKTIQIVAKTEDTLLQVQPAVNYSDASTDTACDSNAEVNMKRVDSQNEETEGFRSLGGKTETVSHSIEDNALDKQREGQSDGFASLGGETEKLSERDAATGDQLQDEDLVADGGFSSIGSDTKIVSESSEDEHGEGQQKNKSGDFEPKGGNLELLGVKPLEDGGQAQIAINSNHPNETNVSDGLSTDSAILENDESALPAALSGEWVKSGQEQLFGEGEQTAAYHIFSACSRLGWAAGLSRYTVGNADKDIVEHLMTAGEHIMWANRTSYPPNPAWPDWSQIRSKYERFANDLANNTTETYRNQLASRLNTSYEPLAQQLDMQTIESTYRTTTCDGQYCRIGYQLAYGQQALAVAEEALKNGDATLASQATLDGKSHVAAARKSMAALDKIVPSSGSCAELSDIRQELLNATQADSPADGRRVAQQKWLETLQRIQGLDTQVASSGGDLIGTWYNEKTGQKIIFEEKDGYIVGIINHTEIYRFRMTAKNQYAGRALVTEHSGNSSRSEWKDEAIIKVIGDKAYLKTGQHSLNLVRNLLQNQKAIEDKDLRENIETISKDTIVGAWQFGRIDQNKLPSNNTHVCFDNIVISIVQQGDTFKVASCNSPTKIVWSLLRKSGNSYMGQAATARIAGMYYTIDQAWVNGVERCLNTPDGRAINCQTKFFSEDWVRIEITLQEKNAIATITGAEYPWDRFIAEVQLLRIE